MDEYSRNKYPNVFYGSLCHLCKQHTVDLKRCAACKMVAYCSKKHQKMDWPIHKEICRVIKNSNLVTYTSGRNLRKWRRYRSSLRLLWQMELERDLLPYESQMWMFPRVCSECLTKTNDLKDCPKCLCVAYCSTEHEQSQKSVHERYCEQLKLCLKADLYLMFKIEIPKETYMPHSDEKIQFPENMDTVMRRCYGETYLGDFTESHLVYVLNTDYLSCVATVAFVLDRFKLYKENMVVHVVGAAGHEALTDWSSASRTLFHCFPVIKSVEWILVGPEAFYYPLFDQELRCSSCSARQKRHAVKAHRKRYEEVIDILPPPDLVVAFNSGIHEFIGGEEDTWDSALSSLLRFTGVPLLLTAYTEFEIEEDSQRISDNVSTNVLLGAQMNPYRSLRPSRDWHNDDASATVAVFYRDSYIAVLEKNVDE